MHHDDHYDGKEVRKWMQCRNVGEQRDTTYICRRGRIKAPSVHILHTDPDPEKECTNVHQHEIHQHSTAKRWDLYRMGHLIKQTAVVSESKSWNGKI